MESNIIKSLVKADKKVREKLTALQTNYDAFLDELPTLKNKLEKQYEKNLNAKVEELKISFELQFQRIKERIDKMHQVTMHEMKDDEIEAIANQLLNAVVHQK